MSLITRILLLALALPFVLAGGGGGNNDNCGSNDFKWSRKSCCLPKGGPPSTPKPPSGKNCPSNWSWNNGLGCCAPHQQPPSNPPPPQCPNGWHWEDGSLCCNPNPTPSNPSNPSTPSRKPDDCDDDDKNGNGKGDGNGKKGNGHKRSAAEKRQFRSRNLAPCPRGLSACPVSSLIGGDYECVDTLVDLDNCGGCATLGEGQNCNNIPGVWNVGCEQSACIIYTCEDGYILSQDGNSCNPL